MAFLQIASGFGAAGRLPDILPSFSTLWETSGWLPVAEGHLNSPWESLVCDARDQNELAMRESRGCTCSHLSAETDSSGEDRGSHKRLGCPLKAVEHINSALQCQDKYLNANSMMELGDLTHLTEWGMSGILKEMAGSKLRAAFFFSNPKKLHYELNKIGNMNHQ